MSAKTWIVLIAVLVVAIAVAGWVVSAIRWAAATATFAWVGESAG